MQLDRHLWWSIHRRPQAFPHHNADLKWRRNQKRFTPWLWEQLRVYRVQQLVMQRKGGGIWLELPMHAWQNSWVWEHRKDIYSGLFWISFNILWIIAIVFLGVDSIVHWSFGVLYILGITVDESHLSLVLGVKRSALCLSTLAPRSYSESSPSSNHSLSRSHCLSTCQKWHSLVQCTLKVILHQSNLTRRYTGKCPLWGTSPSQILWKRLRPR